MADAITFRPITGMPFIHSGDNLADAIIAALEQASVQPRDMDVLVVAQKVVSKAEGRVVALSTVEPGAEALELARATDKDPRIVELILAESRTVIRHRPGILITEHRLGYIMANAGIDQSNIGDGNAEHALLLPVDPDGSATALRGRIERHFDRLLGVIISDSVGRPWRLGTTGMALGAAGIAPLRDYRGSRDLCGRRMEVTEVALIDQVAAGAALAMGEGSEGIPVVSVRGLHWQAQEHGARTLIRSAGEDLFRS